jgi:hypothetical protein
MLLSGMKKFCCAVTHDLQHSVFTKCERSKYLDLKQNLAVEFFSTQAWKYVTPLKIQIIETSVITSQSFQDATTKYLILDNLQTA